MADEDKEDEGFIISGNVYQVFIFFELGAIVVVGGGELRGLA